MRASSIVGCPNSYSFGCPRGCTSLSPTRTWTGVRIARPLPAVVVLKSLAVDKRCMDIRTLVGLDVRQVLKVHCTGQIRWRPVRDDIRDFRSPTTGRLKQRSDMQGLSTADAGAACRTRGRSSKSSDRTQRH